MLAPFAPHLCGARYGRDLVLLDLDTGAYELLAGIADALQLHEHGRVLRVDDEGLFAALAEIGLFGTAPTTVGRPVPRHPRTNRPRLPPAIPMIADRVWMARGWIEMLRLYHGRTFQQMVADARRRSAGSAAVDEAGVFRSAQAFDQLSVWTPFQGECLYRCAMLLRLLGPRGAAVDWVFGVRTWPFVAHCWLQMGDVALTDPAERLEMFTPILAI